MASGLENIETIESPFRRFVTTIGIFPTAFTDAMTYYECLAYLVKYLEETVIPAVNENAEALEELQTLYIQLKSYVDNYFANLDVQEEINNKLDSMVEAGTLQEIITEYLQANVAWTFDTVADMKAATNFVNGSYAQTLGYYSKNDGGASLYKIRTITNDDVVDDSSIIGLYDDTLIAELIFTPVMNLTQFGVSTSNTTNSKFQIALTKCNGRTLIIPEGVYRVDSSMNLPSNIEIKCFGKITYSGDIIYLFQRSSALATDQIKFDGLDIEKLDSSFSNLNRFIYVNGGNLSVTNSHFKNYNTAIHHDGGEKFMCNNITLENVHGTLEQDGYGINTSAKYNTIENIRFINTDNTNGRHAIYLNGNTMVNTYINNVYVDKWHHNPVNINISNTTPPTILIENCRFNDTTIVADGSNPKRVIGVINVTQNSYCNLYVKDVIATLLPNNLICSVSANAKINVKNCQSYHVTSDSDYATGIYLRYGSGTHYINNFQCDNTNDANFLYAVYARQCDLIANGIYETGSNGTSMIISNAATIKLGQYGTSKTVKTLTNSGTVDPISYYTS